MSILVVMEQRGGAWHRMSWETLAAGQQLARELDLPVIAAVPGSGVDVLAGELAAKRLDRVCAVDHELLRDYTPDGYARALRQVIERLRPTLVLFPHTYQVREFLPKLATSLDRVAVTDVIAHRIEAGDIVLVRQLFQGKVNADMRFAGDPPYFASLQAGAYPAGQVAEGRAVVEKFVPRLSAAEIRAIPQEPFRDSDRAVDLSTAEAIVAIGRGVKEADHLPLLEDLARVLGAEMAASRPICDAGWLPMERQVGSSGQTVAPKLYIAVGISGAIQHLVGMRASKTVVVINKDPDAPIFEIADYGIIGDFLQVVPELIAALRNSK